jgi:vacuolar-type H+-ATPase subunit I/STV1
MSTVLLVMGGIWIALGLLAFYSGWFGTSQNLPPPPPDQTATELLPVQLAVAIAVTIEMILAVLLISFGVLFIVASRLVV